MDYSIHKNPAFVLGLFEPGFALVHLLADMNINVTGFATFSPHEIGVYSRKCKIHKIPEPEARDDSLLKLLIQFAQAYPDPPVLYPASDKFVYWMAENEDILKKHFLFLQPPKEITLLFRNKQSQNQLAFNAGLNIPWSVEINQKSDIGTIEKDRFPLLLKGADSTSWKQCCQQKGIEIDNHQELLSQLSKLWSTQQSVILQEIITGPESNLIEVSLLATSESEIISSITVKKIHQFPSKYGTGTLVEQVDFPEIEKMAANFVQKNNLCGILNIEFKISEKNGLIYYIETNIRTWEQIGLTRCIGGNFPLLQYQILTGQPPEFNNKKNPRSDKIIWMDPVAEASRIMKEPNITKALTPYFRTWRQSTVVSSWYWNDPVPFLKKWNFSYKIRAVFNYFWNKTKDLVFKS